MRLGDIFDNWLYGMLHRLQTQFWLKDKPKIISWTVSIFGVIFGQALLLSQHPLTLIYADSPTYVHYTNTILSGTSFGNYQRTLGYPLFLLPFDIGGMHYRAVVIVQIVLAIIGFIEIYGLLYNLTRNRYYPAITVALLSINLEFIQYERTILTEELSIFCAITIFYTLERYLALRKKTYLLLAIVLLGFAMILRPAFIYLPVVLAAGILVYHYFCAKLPHVWLTALLMLLFPFGCIYLQMVINYVSPIHYFGFTNVSNINNLGKILKYHMELLTTDPKYAAIKQAAAQYVASGHYQPVIFVNEYPQFRDPANALAGAYANNIIFHHLLLYLRYNLKDIILTFTTKPFLLGIANRGIYRILFYITNDGELLTYILLPFSILLFLVSFLRKRSFRHNEALMLILAISALGMVILSAVGSFNSYDRLRVPFEWAVYGVVIYSIVNTTKIYFLAKPQQFQKTKRKLGENNA